MDEERRQRLEEKRRLAQLRRQRAAVSEAFRRVGRQLCARGVPFAKLMPAAGRDALGPLTSGPGRDERLDWTWIPNGVCTAWHAEAERDALLREALACCARPETRVAVIWHPHQAGLRLRAGDLAAEAGVVLAEAWEATWIVAAEGGPWLIEVNRLGQREVCFTRSMPLFVGQP